MNTRRHITRRAVFISAALAVLTVGSASGVHVGAASSASECRGLSPASAEGCTSDQLHAALDQEAP